MVTPWVRDPWASLFINALASLLDGAIEAVGEIPTARGFDNKLCAAYLQL